MAIVPQYTLIQCVGASIQTMRNEVLLQIPVSRSKGYQKLVWTRARTYSKYKGDGGADPFGWAASLRLSGAGTYKVVGEPTLAAALWVGAKAMRLTHKPVGALVWNGAHAWSIAAFETTADPATTDDFTVTAAFPSDPLYPRYSNRRWPVVKPHQRMAVSRLATYLTRYRDPRLDPLVQNLFVLIVPVGKDGIVPTPPASLLPPPPPAPPASPAPSSQPDPSALAPSPTPSADAGATPTPAATPSPQPVTEPAATATPAATPTPAVTPTPQPSQAAEEQPTPSPSLPDDPLAIGALRAKGNRPADGRTVRESGRARTRPSARRCSGSCSPVHRGR